MHSSSSPFVLHALPTVKVLPNKLFKIPTALKYDEVGIAQSV
jgi:hypothetical protein